MARAAVTVATNTALRLDTASQDSYNSHSSSNLPVTRSPSNFRRLLGLGPGLGGLANTDVAAAARPGHSVIGPAAIGIVPAAGAEATR
jgi:hypothetical protein